MPEKPSKPDGKEPKPNVSQPRRSAANAGQVKRYYVVLFLAGSDLDRDVFRDVQSQLDELVSTAPSETEIDVWIESYGGDAHAAYKIAIDLRSRCRKLVGVVPDIAKSAATLLVMGMDEIYMQPAAELGPLDLQISHPDREEVIISALDVSDAVEFLAATAVEMVIAGGAGIVHYTGLRRSEVLHETLPFVAQFLEPMVAKLDPHIVHQASNHLNVAEKYAVELLSRKAKPDAKDDCERIANHLIHHYPAHEFVITRREARKIGLPIKNFDTYHKLDKLRMLYNAFSESEDEDTMVLVFDDATFDELEGLMTEPEDGDETQTNETDNEVDAQDVGSESTALSAASVGSEG